MVSFGVQTELSWTEYFDQYPEAYRLGDELLGEKPIDISPYVNIPGITPEKLAALHAAHIEGRKKAGAK